MPRGNDQLLQFSSFHSSKHRPPPPAACAAFGGVRAVSGECRCCELGAVAAVRRLAVAGRLLRVIGRLRPMRTVVPRSGLSAVRRFCARTFVIARASLSSDLAGFEHFCCTAISPCCEIAQADDARFLDASVFRSNASPVRGIGLPERMCTAVFGDQPLFC